MKQGKKLSKILRARELRKESTEAERALWQFLRDRDFLGKKFRRQHIFRGFIIDFYCPKDKLAIELDGFIHLKQKDYDKLRQDLIENFGIRFIRFKNSEIFTNISDVLEKIKGSLTAPLHDNGEGVILTHRRLSFPPSPSTMERDACPSKTR